jgi:hypothetical protein
LRKEKEKHSEKESANFTGSWPLFGKKNLRGTLGYQSSTPRDESAFFLQAGVFKHHMTAKGEVGKGEHQVTWLEGRIGGVAGVWPWRPSGLGSFVCCFSHSFISGSHIFIVPVLLSLPTF